MSTISSRSSSEKQSESAGGSAGGYDVEQTVRERYSAGAQALEPMLCCPATGQYDATYLSVLPTEILERDYGCGDPSQYVGEGEVVVDLGSGAGKICYILSQKVGQSGQVIGVDMNDEMLGLARGYQAEVSGKIGYDNVRFCKGRIQDLALDLDAAQAYLDEHPICGVEDITTYDAHCQAMRKSEPMIGSDSVDVVVSNCVLNLVKPEEKVQLFAEIFRVLKRGGRAVISDIVCDERPTDAIMNDPEMWSGCIAGAFVEDEFLKMFEDAGFYGVEILSRQAEPWHVIDGVEFRSMTIRAYKGKQGPCMERRQAVVYHGPWKQVMDDDGHTLYRGKRMAVCDKTYQIYTDAKGPYAGQLIGIEPSEMVALDEATEFDCRRNAVRQASEMKGATVNGAGGESRGATRSMNVLAAGDSEVCCGTGEGSSGCC